MFKVFVCVTISIAFVAADYDFQKFNPNELEVEGRFLEPLRLKRSSDRATVPKKFHRKRGSQESDYHCCNGDKANAQELRAAKEVKKNCISEVRGGENAKQVSYDPLRSDAGQTMMQEVVCVGECMAKKFNFLAENGDFQRDALLTHTRKMIGDNTWKARVLEGYVDKCLDKLKASKAVKRNDHSRSTTCNPYPLEFHQCMWKEFTQGCPAEFQINNIKCQKIRKHLARS